MIIKVLMYTAGHINYGGRVTDDWDRRCLMSILKDFYSIDALKNDHKYSDSGIYQQIPDKNDHDVSKHFKLTIFNILKVLNVFICAMLFRNLYVKKCIPVCKGYSVQ